MSIDELKATTVTLQNGIELNYVRSGSIVKDNGQTVNKPALVFIHGAMGDYRAFAPQWDAFSAAFDCISYSRRYSYPNNNALNTTDHNALVDADDLIALLDSLAIERAILVGSSYGGFTALAVAVNHPNRVTALVSVEAPMMRYAQADPDGAKIAEDFLKASAQPARDAFLRGDDELGVRLLTGGIIGINSTDVPDDVMQRRLVNLNGAKSLAISDDEFPLLEPEALAKLTMPILLLSGANTAPVHAAIFAAVCKAMPQAQSMIVEGSGHSVSQQASDSFNSKVLSFFNQSFVIEQPRSNNHSVMVLPSRLHCSRYLAPIKPGIVTVGCSHLNDGARIALWFALLIHDHAIAYGKDLTGI